MRYRSLAGKIYHLREDKGKQKWTNKCLATDYRAHNSEGRKRIQISGVPHHVLVTKRN